MNITPCLVFLCLPWLFACQSSHPLQINQDSRQVNLYLDSQFHSRSPITLETEQEIFQLDAEMRAMVQAKLHNNLSAAQKSRILLEHLFNEENIALTYRGNANLTASQTYHRKIANCMSLTIMAYALADEAGMNISFKEVEVPEYWVRNGQYNLLTGHVNLLVLDDINSRSRIVWGESATKIDFDPFVSKKRFPSRTISKKTITAMFYNNKGADALVNDNYAVAYQYLKKATLTDSTFSAAWGNLGILYKLKGHYELAELAYVRAINLQQNNLTSLANLALLFNNQTRVKEAQIIESYIHKLRVENPYYHALLGEEAFFQQSYEQAIQHYKKAIKLDGVEHEFYFALAKVYYHQGELLLAKKAIESAVGYSHRKKTKRQYIAKLNFLNAQ